MATKNELSPFEKEIRSILDKPAGSLLYIAERARKGAIRAIDDYDPEQASEIHTPMLDIRKVRMTRKANWEAQQKADENQGRPEMELPAHSTSADAGKVS